MPLRVERGYIDESGRFHEASRPTHLGASFFEQVAQVAGVDSRVVFRTQLSPEVSIDLAKVAKGDPEATTKAEGGGMTDWLMQLIRPEIEVTALGRQYTVAPWGKPRDDYKLVATVLIGLVAGLAAVKAYELVGKR